MSVRYDLLPMLMRLLAPSRTTKMPTSKGEEFFHSRGSCHGLRVYNLATKKVRRDCLLIAAAHNRSGLMHQAAPFEAAMSHQADGGGALRSRLTSRHSRFAASCALGENVNARARDRRRAGPPLVPSCKALLAFADEQLAAAPAHTVNISHIVEERSMQNAALVVCLHDGAVLYQTADPRRKHVVHGERDRLWSTLQVLHQLLIATRWRGTRCFQHSLRDDQRQNVFGWGDGFGLPALLWHHDAAPGAPPNETPVVGGTAPREGAAWESVASRPRFLWPEHSLVGELIRGLPPAPTFRAVMEKYQTPWAARKDTMLYRGSGIGLTRAHLLECARTPSVLATSAPGGEQHGTSARRHGEAFFAQSADFGQLGWTAGGSLVQYDANVSASRSSSADLGPNAHAGAGAGVGAIGSNSTAGSLRLSRRPMSKPDDEPVCSLGAYASHKHVLWLPGGADWSSALARVMETGGAIYMPSDMGASHSLNTKMLLDYCSGCVTSFARVDALDLRRTRAHLMRSSRPRARPPRANPAKTHLASDHLASDLNDTRAHAVAASSIDYDTLNAALRYAHLNRTICVNLANSFRAAAPLAESRARALSRFVRDELHLDCYLSYMHRIVERMPQQLLHADTAVLSRLKNFSDCKVQRALASRMDTERSTGGSALTRFEAWFDKQRGCALRPVDA